MSLLFQHGNEKNAYDLDEKLAFFTKEIAENNYTILVQKKEKSGKKVHRMNHSIKLKLSIDLLFLMSLLFQHGNGKNAYDPYMGHTNGKELIIIRNGAKTIIGLDINVCPIPERFSDCDFNFVNVLELHHSMENDK
jgi:hypothetical protein